MWFLVYVLRTVLIGLVAAAALALFGRFLRQPGARHDHTRRWVTFAKSALGIWAVSRVFYVTAYLTVLAAPRAAGNDVSVARVDLAMKVLHFLAAVLEAFSNVAVFLTMFYLAHALTLLRTGSDDASRAHRIGSKFALGASGVIVVLAIVYMGLQMSIAVDLIRGSRIGLGGDSINTKYLISWCILYASLGIQIICAIGAVVYATKSRKKALETPVYEAGTLLVVCASLWLVYTVWAALYSTLWIIFYLAILDVFLGQWMIFVILVVLYVLASKDSYGLSRDLYSLKGAGRERAV